MTLAATLAGRLRRVSHRRILVLAACQETMTLKLEDTSPDGVANQLDQSHVVSGCDATPPDSLVSGDLDLHHRVSSWRFHAPRASKEQLAGM